MRRGMLLVAMVGWGCGTGYGPEVDAVLALDGDATAGAEVFAATCGTSSCHGPDGSGSGEAVDLSEHVPHHDDAELVSFYVNGTGEMPAQGLEDQEGADVLAYLRDTFGAHEDGDHDH